MSRCPRCNQVPYPIWDAENKKIIWKNVFHVDWMMLIITITILFSAWAFQHDTAECKKLIEHPCDYVEQFDCNTNSVILRGGADEVKYSSLSIDGQTD